jgi:hypothetical protein
MAKNGDCFDPPIKMFFLKRKFICSILWRDLQKNEGVEEGDKK